MRVIYSILREINTGVSLPAAKDYGLKQREFENIILELEKEGFIERVLRMDTFFSLKPARLTQKAVELLEENSVLEKDYPENKKDLIKWIQVDKELYSNGAEEEY